MSVKTSDSLQSAISSVVSVDKNTEHLFNQTHTECTTHTRNCVGTIYNSKPDTQFLTTKRF